MSQWRLYSSSVPKHRVTRFQNKLLQLTRTTKGPVSEASIAMLDKAASRFRIGMMFGLMGLGLIGSILIIWSGRSERTAKLNRYKLAEQNKRRAIVEKRQKE